MRPYTADYLQILVPDFQELHGDRMYADDPAIIGGMGRIDGRALMFIGHQKDAIPRNGCDGTTGCRSPRAIARHSA